MHTTKRLVTRDGAATQQTHSFALALPFSSMQPKRLVFCAVDGVAPRAKMAEQRKGRFLAAHVAEVTYETGEPLCSVCGSMAKET